MGVLSVLACFSRLILFCSSFLEAVLVLKAEGRSAIVGRLFSSILRKAEIPLIF